MVCCWKNIGFIAAWPFCICAAIELHHGRLGLAVGGRGGDWGTVASSSWGESLRGSAGGSGGKSLRFCVDIKEGKMIKRKLDVVVPNFVLRN